MHNINGFEKKCAVVLEPHRFIFKFHDILKR